MQFVGGIGRVEFAALCGLDVETMDADSWRIAQTLIEQLLTLLNKGSFSALVPSCSWLLWETNCGVLALDELFNDDPRGMPLMRQIVAFFDTKWPRGIMSRYLSSSLHQINCSNCNCCNQVCRSGKPFVQWLLEAGAQLPKYFVTSKRCRCSDLTRICCPIVHNFVDMIRAAQDVCFFFLLVHRFGQVSGLMRLPKDVMLMICRDRVWVSRRDPAVWLEIARDKPKRTTKKKRKE